MATSKWWIFGGVDSVFSDMDAEDLKEQIRRYRSKYAQQGCR